MRFYIGNTDYKWYSFLKAQTPEDVNFWQPGGKSNFKLLPPGGPFLLKLKAPYNAIAGVGFFSSHSILPLSIAWDAFGVRNGCTSLHELLTMISGYRKEWWDENPQIGCIVLTNPIFFEQEDWIDIPSNWSKSIVQGKSYDTSDSIGEALWARVDDKLKKYLFYQKGAEEGTQLLIDGVGQDARFRQIVQNVRMGQGAFRILITDAYSRKCSISGEKTLPVLQAAHIKPFSKDGPHIISNGLLLRSDLHKLFDDGYITITEDCQVEVSRRIKEEFSNGKEYYRYHGAFLQNLPANINNKPKSDFLRWHNENVFFE